MTAWLVFVIVGLGTYAMRASLIVLLSDATIPHVLERAFRYVGPAVLAAIAATGLLPTEDVTAGDLAPRLVAAAVTGLVAWRTENLLASMATGLTVFFGLAALMGV